MLALFLKVVLTAFFAFVAVDSFFKAARIKRDVRKELTSKKLGAILGRRVTVTGWVFSVLALLGFVSFFLRIAALGE